MQFVKHSEVKFVCVSVSEYIRHWSLRIWAIEWAPYLKKKRKKYMGKYSKISERPIKKNIYRKIWISHWPKPTVQPPSYRQSLRRTPKPMRTCREHKIACGDWLVCQTTPVCNNPITCTARILASAFRAVRMLLIELSLILWCSYVTRTAILI